jgi:hypothetical protein
LILAVVAEAASLTVSTDIAPTENWAHLLEGAFEEGAELGGWILLAAAFAAIAWDAPLPPPREGSSGHVDAPDALVSSTSDGGVILPRGKRARLSG